MARTTAGSVTPRATICFATISSRAVRRASTGTGSTRSPAGALHAARHATRPMPKTRIVPGWDFASPGSLILARSAHARTTRSSRRDRVTPPAGGVSVCAGLAMPLDDVDLTDLERFARGFPHHVFKRLRHEAPVWFHPPTPHTPGGEGFWVLSRHADIVAAAADGITFSSV